jgi:hypothetical protein
VEPKPLVPVDLKQDLQLFKVIDQENKPIELASIVYLKHLIGTMTNEFGVAQLPIRNDSIKVSCIGFKDTLITIDRNFKKEILLKLQSNSIQLAEVKVNDLSHCRKPMFYGDDEVTRSYLSAGYGSQIAYHIHNKKDGILNVIKLNHLRTKYNSLVRIEIKGIQNNKPSPTHILLDTIINIKQGNKVSVINFNARNVFLQSGGFFIVTTKLGLADMKDGDYLKYVGQNFEPYFLLTSKKEEENTYLNHLNRNWKAYPKVLSIGNKASITNAIFSCVVLE